MEKEYLVLTQVSVGCSGYNNNTKWEVAGSIRGGREAHVFHTKNRVACCDIMLGSSGIIKKLLLFT